MTSGTRPPWLQTARRLATRVPWIRLGSLLAVVTIGLSHVVFNVIQRNLDFFPGSLWFFFSVIFFVQILPFALLFLGDTLLIRGSGDGRAFRIWRSVLTTALFLSVLRQVQVYYPDPFWALMARVPPLPALLALTVLAFLVCLRFHRPIRSYLAWLGLLSLAIPAVFLGNCAAFSGSWAPGIRTTADVPEKDLPPVVMIVFDELSQAVLEKGGEIDGTRFPNFAALARDGAYFPNASANQMLTTEAFPCFLTGFIEPRGDAPTLFDRLPDGYDIRLRLGSTASYDWIRRHAREDQRFSVYSWSEEIISNPLEVPRYLYLTLSQTPFLQSPFAGQQAVRLTPPVMWVGTGFEFNLHQDVEDFLEEISSARAGRRPFLFWHCFLPHFPFQFDGNGAPHARPHKSFSRAPGSVDSIMLSETSANRPDSPTGYSPDAVYENYRAQVEYVDRIVGRVIARLKKEGLYEKSVIVVTSDHGLRTWGEMEPDGYPDVFGNFTPRIPLFIRAPGVPPGRSDVDAQQIDMVATILDLVGDVGAAADTEGVSVFAPERPKREKYFVNSFIGHKPRWYRYDAAADLWKLTRPPSPRSE